MLGIYILYIGVTGDAPGNGILFKVIPVEARARPVEARGEGGDPSVPAAGPAPRRGGAAGRRRPSVRPFVRSFVRPRGSRWRLWLPQKR